MLIYLAALTRNWSMSFGGSTYKVSKNFPRCKPTSKACMDTVGCKSGIFSMAWENMVLDREIKNKRVLDREIKIKWC